MVINALTLAWKPAKREQVIMFGIFILLAQGCASTLPSTQSQLKNDAFTTRSGNSQSNTIRERLQHYYLSWKGVPYKSGGNDKRGIDCSGFVHQTFKNALGLVVPRSTRSLEKTGTPIQARQLSAGDLVFFKTGFAKHHVGIYVGSGQFIHASTSKGVMKSKLNSPYWSKHYWKATRVLSI